MEQLRLFDPDHFLCLDGTWCLVLDCSDEELEFITQAAEALDMDLSEYVNYALRRALDGVQPTGAQ